MDRVWKLLIAANVAVFAARFPLGERMLYDLFGLHTADVMERGQVWQLLSYGFLHADGSHLLFNMLGIYFFGSLVEERIGARRFRLFYLFCVLLAGAVQILVDLGFRRRGGVTVGASGGIMGILVMCALCEPRRVVYLWGLFGMEMRFLVPAYVLLDLVGAGSGFSGIAHAAHLGGALGGLLYYWVVFERMGGTLPLDFRVRTPFSDDTDTRRKAFAVGPVHHCAVCAKTERDGREFEFRVCTACGGREFCQEHLAGHDCQTGR